MQICVCKQYLCEICCALKVANKIVSKVGNNEINARISNFSLPLGCFSFGWIDS